MAYREQRYPQRKTEDLKVAESLENLNAKIFFITQQEKNKSRKEKKIQAEKESSVKRSEINTRRALEHHIRKVNCNFDQSDYVIHATFNSEKRPLTRKEINNEFTNYIKRINGKRKRLGLKNAKYMAVIEGGEGTEKEVHFHIIIDGRLDRNILENLWGKRGFVNVDRLQPNEEGLTGLTKYMSKGHFEELEKGFKEEIKEDKKEEGKEEKSKRPKGTKRWRTSKGNLKTPVVKVNDSKFTKNKVRDMFINTPSREEIEKLYPGYTLTYYKAVHNEEYDQYYIDIHLRRYVKNVKIEVENKDGTITIKYKPKTRKYKRRKKKVKNE